MGRKGKRRQRTEAATPEPAAAPPARGRGRAIAIAIAAAVVIALLARIGWARWRPPRNDADVRARLARQSPAPEGLNVVVVTLDTTRADRLGCYGFQGVATPHIDALARDGVVFDNATAVVPLTFPSHSSMFTGLVPPHHGVRDNGGFFLDDA